jgi:hypothetical protein
MGVPPLEERFRASLKAANAARRSVENSGRDTQPVETAMVDLRTLKYIVLSVHLSMNKTMRLYDNGANRALSDPPVKY